MVARQEFVASFFITRCCTPCLTETLSSNLYPRNAPHILLLRSFVKPFRPVNFSWRFGMCILLWRSSNYSVRLNYFHNILVHNYSPFLPRKCPGIQPRMTDGSRLRRETNVRGPVITHSLSNFDKSLADNFSGSDQQLIGLSVSTIPWMPIIATQLVNVPYKSTN